MAYSNGKISAPVSIYDIQRCLGLSNNNIGALIANGNINMWSKFKPVYSSIGVGCAYTALDTVVDNQYNATTKKWRRDASPDQWWRDTSLCKYGIIPVRANSMSALYSLYSTDWRYQRPTGGRLEPYRMADFNEYWHTAPSPSGRVAADSYVVVVDAADGGWSVNCALLSAEEDADPIENRDYIVPEDILKEIWGVNQVYFGFALFEQNQANPQPILWVTGTRYTGMGSTYLHKGTYYDVMPFYCSQEIPEDFSQSVSGRPGDYGGALFARIPLLSSMPVLQTAPAGQISPKARYLLKATLINGRCTVTATITAETDGSVIYTGGSFSNIHVLVCKQTYDPSQVAQAGDIIKDWNIGTVNVASGSKWVGPGSNAGASVSTSEDRVMCYLMENGVRRAMANAIIQQEVTPT